MLAVFVTRKPRYWQRLPPLPKEPHNFAYLAHRKAHMTRSAKGVFQTKITRFEISLFRQSHTMAHLLLGISTCAPVHDRYCHLHTLLATKLR
jgi:hypothetical protein